MLYHKVFEIRENHVSHLLMLVREGSGGTGGGIGEFPQIRLSRYLIVVDVTGLGRIQTLNIAECNMTLTCKAMTNNNNAAPEGKFPLCLQPLIELTVHFFLNVNILHLQSVAF
jgi:hypothetical protein